MLNGLNFYSNCSKWQLLPFRTFNTDRKRDMIVCRLGVHSVLKIGLERDVMRKHYDFDYVEMGKRIETRRKELSLSQKDLAEMIGCEYSYMSKVEAGKARPTLGLVRLIAIKLDVSVDYFIEGTKGYSQTLDVELRKMFEGCSVAEKKLIVEFIFKVRSFLQGATDRYET